MAETLEETNTEEEAEEVEEVVVEEAEGFAIVFIVGIEGEHKDGEIEAFGI